MKEMLWNMVYLQNFAAEILTGDPDELSYEHVKTVLVKAGGANYGTGKSNHWNKKIQHSYFFPFSFSLKNSIWIKYLQRVCPCVKNRIKVLQCTSLMNNKGNVKWSIFMLKVQLKYPFYFMDAYLTNDTFFLIAFATSVFRSFNVQVWWSYDGLKLFFCNRLWM